MLKERKFSLYDDEDEHMENDNDDDNLWRCVGFLQEWFIRPDGNASTFLSDPTLADIQFVK